MNAESPVSKLDSLKLASSFTLVAAAIGTFYYFSTHSLLLRVLGLLAAAGVAVVIAVQTDRGRQIVGFLRDAQLEVRKVVWPTRRETTQTTLIVIAMVVAVATFLWVLDVFLGWAVRGLTGQGG